MSIDWDKPVQTRDGREVVIYTTEGQGKNYPVVGEFSAPVGWMIGRWTIDGEYVADETDNHDLINVPKKHTFVANIYQFGTCGSPPHISFSLSKAEADLSDDRIACIEVTFTEGEGME